MNALDSFPWRAPRALVRSLTMALALWLGGVAPGWAQELSPERAARTVASRGDAASAANGGGWTAAPALERRVREAVAECWGVSADAVRLEWGAVRAGLEPDANAPFRLLGTGTGGGWVVAFDDTGSRVRLRAGVENLGATAARDLPRQTTLEENDILWTQTVVWGPPAEAEQGVEPGWVTRRRIARGEALRAPAVSPPDAVTTGERVQAIWARGTVRLSLPARALGSAAVGERVWVRTDTGKRFEAVAAGPALVHIDPISEGTP